MKRKSYLGAVPLLLVAVPANAQEPMPTPLPVPTPAATQDTGGSEGTVEPETGGAIPPSDSAPVDSAVSNAASGDAASSDAASSDADEPEMVIVITPTRNPQSIAEATSTVTAITRRQIEQKKAFDVTDVLRLAPSLSVFQGGSRGQLSSIFLRGAAPRQTLVLVDGMRINAPSFGTVDFGTIPVENIERIEVLRGPQSGIYGSDALGGVVNIITRRGAGEFRTGGRIEFGSATTNRQVVTAGGELGRTRLSLSATRLQSEGFRSNEDYRNLGTSLRLDRALSEKSNLAFIGRFEDSRVGVPGSIYFSDPNERNDVRNLFGSVEYTRQSGRRRDRIALGIFDRVLEDTDPADASDFFNNSGRLEDRSLTMEAQSSFALGRHTLTTGVEYRRERAAFSSTLGNYREETETRSIFIQDEFRVRRLSLVPSLRLEDSSKFGGDLNGRLSAGYDLGRQSKLKATIGTGFRIPTLDQLYYPGFSNPALQPEKSTGYEVGYERLLPDGGRLELTVFRNQFRNLIDALPPAFIPLNVTRARTQGLEIYLNQPFGNGFRAIINHAFLNNSAPTNQYLVRRPKFTTAADLLYRRGRVEYDLGVIAQGSRYDVGAAGIEKFGGHTRFDLTVGYDLRPGVQAYVRAQNLFNRRYQEIAGFPAPRFNFVVGLQTRAF